MIIFDLDGTLADCEHRRHFVHRYIACDHWHQIPNHPVDMCDSCKDKHKKWKPEWKSFYEDCDQDKPIESTITVIRVLLSRDYYSSAKDVHIWSGRCESVRKKTEDWLDNNSITYNSLKMRPIGDSTPDDQLKEKWLDESLAKGNTIDFVFDDRPKVVRMWRRRGIFVFNCCQHDREF